MVLSLEKAQQKIQLKIFDAIGSNATITNEASHTTDAYGDRTTVYAAGTSVTLVPFNSVATEEYQPFGDLQSGQLDMIIPYDTVINDFAKITYQGKDYIVKEYETYPYQNGSLAIAVRLARKL